MTIHTVTAQVRGPLDGDHGQVTEGFYKIEGDYLQMTFRDGKPLEDPRFRVLLTEGADPRAVASRLTLEVRRELSGELVEGFNRILTYRSNGIA